MRLRRKPWARPELEACPFYVAQPAENRGKWHSAFDSFRPIHVELGCGKGSFIAQTAAANPNTNYIAIDLKSEVLALAKRNIEQAYSVCGRAPGNVRIFHQEIALISQVFSPHDTVDRIYINFANPWPKERHKKRRLTHPRQLEQYRNFLSEDGILTLKTDDKELFEDSLDYLEGCDFQILCACQDLYENGIPSSAILTEHEKMFLQQGLQIYWIKAQKQQNI